jgi:hypothetical protein
MDSNLVFNYNSWPSRIYMFNMINNVKLAMQKPFDVNPLTKLLKIFSSS